MPFCEHLKTLCDEFYFIAMENGGVGGYQVSQEREYVIDYKAETKRAENEILSADAVILGASPDSLVNLRMKENKLSFIYSERIFKKGTWRRVIPKTRKHIKNRYINHKDKNLYVLAASCFLPYDLSLFGFNNNKVFKWGYFPDCANENIERKQDNTILYAGRFIKLKHIETVIEVANLLNKDGFNFKINIVGEGIEEQSLKELVNKYGLHQKVEFLGSKPHKELMEIMQTSQIFMFTSDFNEGWGAVVNEAMEAGCVPVVSSAVGSSGFLIKHNENGKIYKFGNYKNAYKAVKELLENKEQINVISNNAKAFIENEYNYKVAAERFINAVNEFYRDGKITPFENGVLSGVQIIKNNWFK